MTGLSFFRTSTSKVSSVTTLVAPTCDHTPLTCDSIIAAQRALCLLRSSRCTTLTVRFPCWSASAQRRARPVTNGHEDTGHRQHLLGAVLGAPQPQAGDLARSEDLDHLAVPHERDLRVGERPLLHDLRGAERVAPVDHRHRLTEPGEEHGLFHGRVAAADDRDVVAAEEEPVTGRAPGN